MKKYIIYKLVFPNNKIYIGQTKQNFKKRLNQHYTQSVNKKSKNYNFLICRAIRKYNWDDIKKEILCIVSKEFVDEAEIYFIKEYQSNNKRFGYNIESGGNKNKHLSEETKQLMSKAKLGENNPNYGKKHSKEIIEKMSKAKLGKNHPMFGKHHSIKSKQLIKQNHMNVSGKNNPMFGKHHSEETKQKMKNAKLRK